MNTQEIAIEYLVERIGIDVQLPEDLPIDDDYWYNTYNIPKPDNYDELKKAILDKQKALQGVDDIESDPENIPLKKPVKKPTQQGYKPKAKFKRLRNFLRKSGLSAFFS